VHSEVGFNDEFVHSKNADDFEEAEDPQASRPQRNGFRPQDGEQVCIEKRTGHVS